MLVPVPEPMIRKIDPNAWRFINHRAFNGDDENLFTRTSLHLSFTGYYRPIELNDRGEQDVRVSVLESVISVHDAGKWVADLNISAMLDLPQYTELLDNKRCRKGQAASHRTELVSIENWDETFELPSRACVVRTKRNPTARLAVVAVLLALQRKEDSHFVVRVCPPQGTSCLFCTALETAVGSYSVLIH